MNLKKLSNEDIEKIYNKYMKIDFPPEELKPLEIIQKLIMKKNYTGYGLFKDKELLAYTFLITSQSYAMFDYYAVCESYRNKGTGSQFINILKENLKSYDGIIVEVESIECASNEAEKLIRKRRIDFYKRNGMIMTNVTSVIFNVNYSIMCLCNVQLDDSHICEGLKNIYKEMIPRKLYFKYVKVDCKN